VVVALRRLVAEHGRGQKPSIDLVEETTAERLVAEGAQLLGAESGLETAAPTASAI
jgi:hypothetical protein